MTNDPSNQEVPQQIYHSNKIPFFIKLVWAILALWAIYYILAYAIPDLKLWLEK